jgi:hypothetical protein
MPAEPAKPAVGMSKLFEIEHNAGPVGMGLPGGLLGETLLGEHG